MVSPDPVFRFNRELPDGLEQGICICVADTTGEGVFRSIALDAAGVEIRGHGSEGRVGRLQRDEGVVMTTDHSGPVAGRTDDDQ